MMRRPSGLLQRTLCVVALLGLVSAKVEDLIGAGPEACSAEEMKPSAGKVITCGG